jgi:hypothetical protein
LLHIVLMFAVCALYLLLPIVPTRRHLSLFPRQEPLHHLRGIAPGW